MCDATSVQQQASGRLQTLYEEVVLRAHTNVRVRVYCVCQEIHTYTTTYAYRPVPKNVVPVVIAICLRKTMTF